MLMSRLSQASTSRLRKLGRELYKHRWYYLLLLPAVAYFVIFKYVPMYGITIAFKDFKLGKGILDSGWADPWFKCFKQLFRSELFWRSVKNTLSISFLKIIVAFPIPIIFALLIDALPGRRFKKTVQTVSYLPYFISWVVLGGILRSLLSPTYGAINYILGWFGVDPIHFLAEEEMFQAVLFITHVWQTVGYGSIVYLAAIAGVDQEIYEAARVDGARRIQMMLKITIPCIASTILTMLILDVGKFMSAGFDQVQNLYNPVVYSTGDIIDTFTYRAGLVDRNYSYSTAASLFQNIIGLILLLITNYVSKKVDSDSGLV